MVEILTKALNFFLQMLIYFQRNLQTLTLYQWSLLRFFPIDFPKSDVAQP